MKLDKQTLKKHLLYHGKWQFGTLVVLPMMYLFIDYLKWPYWSSLISINFIGAIIFYPIDKWIFKNKNKQS